MREKEIERRKVCVREIEREIRSHQATNSELNNFKQHSTTLI